MRPHGVPPEIVQAAEAEAERLLKAIEKDMPDSVDLTLVKPRVMQALVLAFCRGTLLFVDRAIDEVKRISDDLPPRRPINKKGATPPTELSPPGTPH
jgi:hypothetical protein